MSSQQDDASRLIRPRANTSGFAFSGWRRGRPEVAPTPNPGPSTTVPILPLEDLIEALTPPAVPSLNRARSLASALSAHTPAPKLAVLSPILASLCSKESPIPLQAAGYEILAAYWEKSSSAALSTADRLSCLSLFLNPTVPWATNPPPTLLPRKPPLTHRPLHQHLLLQVEADPTNFLSGEPPK